MESEDQVEVGKEHSGNGSSEYLRLPWRIDKDNAQGIEIIDDSGDLIFIEDWGGIPTERGAAFADQIINKQRACFYAALNSVNSRSVLVAALKHALETKHDRTCACAKCEDARAALALAEGNEVPRLA